MGIFQAIAAGLAEMRPIDWAAFGLGVINVTLVVRRSIWNYPFAMASVALYALIFFEAKLYSDTLLQLFYIVVNAYGWWNWLRSRAETGEVVVLTLGGRERSLWLAGCAAATLGWGWMMHRYTDASYPFWDAGVAMVSVAAQTLQSRRMLESWVLWIAVDLAAIPLYAQKNLWGASALYTVFLVLSILGLIEWERARRKAAA